MSRHVLAVIAIVAGTLQAQTASNAPPRFEVASIRPSKNPEPGGNVEITPGRFRGKDLALQWLILTAFRIKSGNLSGSLPDWTISERYDIDARTGDASGEDRVLIALQHLLEDRFQLRHHPEMREQPVYFLRVAKGGAKMPAGSCVPVKKDLPNECYSRRSEGLVETLDWRGVAMSDPTGVAYRSLAWSLAGPLRRSVIDQTGLRGTFDVHLRWARDPQPPTSGLQGEAGLPELSPETAAPSLFDAVETQLGLKLEPGRGPVEYLIVDHVQKPGDN